MKFTELMKDFQGGHSTYQTDYFITSLSGGSLYGQYKQALRELHTRFLSLKELYIECKKIEIDIDEINWSLENDTHETKFIERRLLINLHSKKLRYEELKISIEDTRREFKRFYQQAVYLKNELGELTDEIKEELEKESWIYWIKERAALELMIHKQLSEDTIQMLHYSPPDVKNNVLDLLENGDILGWYRENKDSFKLPNNLPDVSLPSPDEVLALK